MFSIGNLFGSPTSRTFVSLSCGNNRQDGTNQTRKQRKMRRLTLAAMAALTLTADACSGRRDANSEQNQEQTNETKENQSMKTIQLTRELFKQRVMDYETGGRDWKFLGTKPAIIDFYATWCGPCKRVAPILEEIAQAYDGRLDVYKVDVDQEGELAALFGVQSIPTILFIPQQGLPQKQVGALSKAQFEEQIKSLLLKD